MEFGVSFMLLLLMVGGLAAYQGDIVGMRVGKKRLSIFGLRPRYTSRIVAISTGVFIVLFTLISMIALSSNVRQALFGMEHLRSTVLALSSDVTKKNTELKYLEQQQRELSQGINQLSSSNNHLQTVNSQMQVQNKALRVQSTQLQTLNKQLRAEKDTLTKRTADLQNERLHLESDRELLVKQLAELRKAGDYYFDQANRLQQANSDLRQANFIYHALDVIATLVVDTRLGEATLTQQLYELVDNANQKVLARGAGNKVNGVGIRIDRIVQGQDGQLTPISADTVVVLAVEAIRSDPTVQSVIVQLVALTNAASGETVLADFNLVRNSRLYREGEVVAKRMFDGRLPRNQLFEAFVVWLQGSIRQAARDKGLMPQNDGTFGGVPPSEIYAVVDHISAAGKLVEIQAYAAKECWTKGPLMLGFQLHPVD